MPPASDRIEEILARWVERIRPDLPDGEHAEALLRSYRGLARFVLRHGLAEEGTAVEAEDVDLLLASVARANRRSGASISATLRLFGYLGAVVLSTIRSRDDVSRETLEILKAVTRVHTVLDDSLSRLVRILEESETRARRERASATAAMLDLLSHELDNRLGAVRTATDMLDSQRIDLGPGDLERVGGLIRSALDDALKTVDDVEALIGAWGEEPDASAGSRSMPLVVLLRKLLDELEPVAREASVRLEGPDSRPATPVDPARLRLVLYNLISNGIKYHDPDEEDRWVRISAEELDDGRLRLRVADNGIGIADEDHERVFLYRARADAGNDVDGSGLGLAIAREAVDQLGGALELESRAGEGSTFTVTFDPRG